MPAPFNMGRAMLHKLIQAGAIVALLTGDAYCQVGGTTNSASDPMHFNMAPGASRRTPEEELRDREVESKYRETVSKIPDKKASSDPWGNVRAAPDKTSSKAKPRQP